MLDYCVMNQVRYTEIRALNVIHTHLMGPVPQILSCNLGHLLCTGDPREGSFGMFKTPEPLAYTRPTVVQLDFSQLPPLVGFADLFFTSVISRLPLSLTK